MAYKIEEDYASRGGGADKKTRTYRIGYVVTGTGTGTTALAVRSAIGIFPYQTAWRDDPMAVCVNCSESQESHSVWRSDIKFSTVTEDPDDNAEDPIRRPPKRSSSFIDRDTFPHKDIEGKVVANSAGQRYTEYSEPETIKVLTIQRNEGSHNFLEGKYENKTNSGAFYGRPKDNCLSKPITATEEYENGSAYAAVTYTFHFLPEGKVWVAEFIDAGRYYLSEENHDWVFEVQRKRHIMLPEDNADTKFSDEVALDGNGGLLSQDEIDAGNFRTRKFKRFKSVSFRGLNLEW